MGDSELNMDGNFFQLVVSLQIAAMQYMGKITSPITGKVERNLEQAKASVDMLAMLETKTKNNLTSDEQKFLSGVLANLRLNYVDEINKPPSQEQAEDKKADEGKSS